MKITKSWLLARPIKFWSDLYFLLCHTSPYFGKLGWRFKPGLDPLQTFNNHLDSASLTQLKQAVNQLPDNANEEQICRNLMTTIFWVSPDYNRTEINFPPLEQEEWQRAEMARWGWEHWPTYPHYYVYAAPTNYRPLKLEEIQLEDIQKFQQKIQVLKAPLLESLIEAYQSLGQHHRTRLNQVKKKLAEWTQLITNHHE